MTRKKTIRTKTVKILQTKKQRIARMGKMARTEKMARMEKIARIVKTVKIKIRRKRKRRPRKMPICLYNKVGMISYFSKLVGTDCLPELNIFFYIQYFLLTISYYMPCFFHKVLLFWELLLLPWERRLDLKCPSEVWVIWYVLSQIIYVLVLICIVPVVSDFC